MYSVKAFFTWSAAALVANAMFVNETLFPFHPPGDKDLRSPCPGINALANHGLIARDGRNVSLDALAMGLYNAFHLDYNAGVFVGKIGFTTSTTGNPLTINLDNLAQHTPQALEHDFSMSRNDSYWGDNLHFNQQVWDRTLASWGKNETITFAVAAAELKARLAYGVATNPEGNVTFAVKPACLEYSLVLSAFGDPVAGNGKASLLKYLIEKERLPFELGYQPPKANTTKETALAMAAKIAALL